MKERREPERPLIARVADDSASRVAMLQSLSRETTGLATKVHNGLIEMLVVIATEHFSDGATTEARNKRLGAVLNRDMRTIQRRMRVAESLGLITSRDRTGAIGQQISSQRTIQWDRVRELLVTQRAAKQSEASEKVENATDENVMGACHLSPPHDTCHPPMTPVTPCIRDNSGIEDKKHSPPLVGPRVFSGAFDPWEVVVSVLLEIGMVMAREAVQKARARNLTIDDVEALIARWRDECSRDPDCEVSWLYRWLVGKSQPLKPKAVKSLEPRPTPGLTSETTRWHLIEARIVKAGRKANASEERIRERVSEAKERFDSGKGVVRC